MIDKFSDLKKDFNRKFVKPRYVDDLDLGIFWGWIIENFEPRNIRLEQQVIPQLISKYEKLLDEISEGIPQFEAMGIMPKVQLQKGKQVTLIEVLDDLKKLAV